MTRLPSPKIFTGLSANYNWLSPSGMPLSHWALSRVITPSWRLQARVQVVQVRCPPLLFSCFQPCVTLKHVTALEWVVM